MKWMKAQIERLKLLWGRVKGEPDPRPLIWTLHGNRPIDELRMEIVWDIQPGAYIKVREIYYDKLTGELEKESAHAYDLRGSFGSGAVNGF